MSEEAMTDRHRRAVESVETRGTEPLTPALQRWPASTSNDVLEQRHAVLLSSIVKPHVVSRAVSRRWGVSQ